MCHWIKADAGDLALNDIVLVTFSKTFDDSIRNGSTVKRCDLPHTTRPRRQPDRII